MNPFTTSGYISPEYFCDREKETKRLKSAIQNNSNVTLLSIRRMGKTGLIKHVYNSIEGKNSNLVYVDIAHTENLQDFIKLFSNSILKKFQSKPEKFFKELGSMLRNLRPIMKFDEKTGDPQISLTFLTPGDAESSLDSIFEYLLEQSGKKQICIAIDEFQQITKYPEKNIEALLRSKIQQTPRVSFVFSGSKNSIMHSIFYDARRPFYQSTELLHLDKIDNTSYLEFIKAKFQIAGVTIEDKIIELILEWTRTHTYYVQYFCYKLFSLSEKTILKDTFYFATDSILEENETIYQGYKNILTDSQWNLLKAIAMEGSVSKPTAIDFIKKYSLGSASSVSYLIKKLLQIDFLYEESGNYYVYDVFFSRWLERV